MIAAATPILDPFVIQQAEICASRMVGNYGFSPDDWEDLRQELVLDYPNHRPICISVSYIFEARRK